MRNALIALGTLFLAAGVFWPFVARYFGKLPGDIVIRKPGFTFVLPIVTCLVLSLLVTLLLWVFRK